MRTLVLAAALCGIATLAEARPDSLRMTCHQASGLVQSRGGIVLGTGPDIYDRFVTGCGFCPDMSFIRPAWIQTADNPQCFVGYVCRDNSQFHTEANCGFTGYRGP